MGDAIGQNIAPASLQACAVRVLLAAGADEKTTAVDHAESAIKTSTVISEPNDQGPPRRPGRPARPLLVDPTKTPRRSFGSVEGRASLIHAIGHIEFNAINLAFDMAARFGGEIGDLGLDPYQFYRDWFSVGVDEARHFRMIAGRLEALGYQYGDFAAHNGLWDAAEDTGENLLARLVVAPLILEARGLDVTPMMIKRLEAQADTHSAEILAVILQEEVAHVACGKLWFDQVCGAKGLDPLETFHGLKQDYFKGRQKPPFNHDARQRAGLEPAYYERK